MSNPTSPGAATPPQSIEAEMQPATARLFLMRLMKEVRRPGLACRQPCDPLAIELGIGRARYSVAIAEPAERGRRATWRLRVIERPRAHRVAISGDRRLMTL